MKIQIINSKGHWFNGWFLNANSLQTAVDTLSKAGIRIAVEEVENVTQLEQVLKNIPPDTLVWGNAYYVNASEGQVVWLNDYLQARGLPFLGAGATTLKQVLKKDVCQTILAKEGLPVPPYLVIAQEKKSFVEQVIRDVDIDFPWVLKPTSESGSVGVTMAYNLDEAAQKARQILQDYPLSKVIVEAFLPGKEITCGFLQLADEMLLLPTYYELALILDRDTRLQAWDSGGKEQLILTDDTIRAQLKGQMPRLVEALDIQDISRVDGRIDSQGMMRYFDINGLPGLSFPRSITVKQCCACFPMYAPQEVYEALLNTIVHNALLRYNMEVPLHLQKHNLFTLKSNIVIKNKVPSRSNILSF
ncbi:hypothetical protein [uncultured Microscilla sp.]|uniref:hypothetical protein n=1 Tax=uncultured Microscilla sp. TaxID=432653 RepID=UPI0026123DF8|nr:hypothetical protein [uncultured Microscilla sp.]